MISCIGCPDRRGATVKLVNDLLVEAVQVGASDVHLQPFEDYVIVRMRLDGVLEDIRKLPRTAQDEVFSRLKAAGKMNIANDDYRRWKNSRKSGSVLGGDDLSRQFKDRADPRDREMLTMYVETYLGKPVERFGA